MSDEQAKKLAMPSKNTEANYALKAHLNAIRNCVDDIFDGYAMRSAKALDNELCTIISLVSGARRTLVKSKPKQETK